MNDVKAKNSNKDKEKSFATKRLQKIEKIDDNTDFKFCKNKDDGKQSKRE